MKYKSYTIPELLHLLHTTRNPLEKEILSLYINYRKLLEASIEELRESWRRSDGEEKELITKVGLWKKEQRAR